MFKNLGLFAILIFLLTPGLHAEQQEDEQGAYFRYLRGTVSIRDKNGESHQATKESAARAGDSILVGEDSLAIVELEDKSTLKLESNTELGIEELIKEEGDNDGNGEYSGTSSLVLKVGNIFVEVAQKFSDSKDEPPSLNIKNTRSVALGVRGTEFFAGIDEENGDMYSSVKSGEVEVYDVANDDSDSIKAGESVVVEKGSSITRPHRFEWAKKLNWEATENEGARQFKSTRREARQEFESKRSELMARNKNPVRNRFNNWQKRRSERRKPLEKNARMLERRSWKGQPGEFKQRRMQQQQRKNLKRRLESQNQNDGNGRKNFPARANARPNRPNRVKK